MSSRALALRSRRPQPAAASKDAEALTSPPDRWHASVGRSRRIGRHGLRYGGPWFSAASALPLKSGLGHPRQLGQVLLEGAQHPHRLAALIMMLLLTPPERVYLSDSRAGGALRAYFDRCFLRVFPQNRLCRGVLLLPAEHSEYVRGRRRQALRTNLRRAAAAGVRCETAVRPSAAFAAAEEIVLARRAASTAHDRRGLQKAWSGLFTRPEVTVLVARDPRGRPLAITAAVIDEAVTLVEFAVACDHHARWALHDHLVRLLISRGVGYLFVEGDGPFGALGFDPDVHHFQHLLGYELRHLIPRGRGRVSRPLAA